MSHTRTISLIATAALALAACAAPTAAPRPTSPIAITPETGSEVAKYLRLVRSTLPGAFAVSPDGRNSYFTYCDEITCAVTNYSQPALRGCQSLAGTPCVIIYVRNEQRGAITRTETAGTGGRHGSEEQRQLDFDFHDRRA